LQYASKGLNYIIKRIMDLTRWKFLIKVPANGFYTIGCPEVTKHKGTKYSKNVYKVVNPKSKF